MNRAYLEVTFRHGLPVAAYYYLPTKRSEKSHRSEEVAPGLVVDYNKRGTPIGIEIVDPQSVTVIKFNRVLRELGLPAVKRDDLAPLQAA